MKNPKPSAHFSFSLTAAAIVCYLAGTAAAHATMAAVLCTVYDIVVGPIGEGVASAGVIALGIGAVMGKVSLGMALTVAIGIMITFSAPFITQELILQFPVCP